MSVIPSSSGRFSTEKLYAPKSIVLVGTGTPERARVEQNLREGGFTGRMMKIGGDRANWAETYDCVADLPEPPDLTILTSLPDDAGPLLNALGKRGARAGVALSYIPDLAALSENAGMRMLGPTSFGIAIPRLGLNASLSHMPVPAGRVYCKVASDHITGSVLARRDRAFMEMAEYTRVVWTPDPQTRCRFLAAIPEKLVADGGKDW